MVLWIVGFGVSKGVLAEASLLGLKVEDLSILLLGLPLVGSAIVYGVAVSYSQTIISRSAFERITKNHWKKIYASDLQLLILPPTFFTLEQIIHPNGESTVIDKVNSV